MTLTKVTYSMIVNAPVNVKDFGATGDGVTNDSVAAQSAWDTVKANGGGMLYFPAGTYLINISGLGSDGVSIIGDGAATILSSYADNNWAVKYDTGYLKLPISIQNLSFENKGTAQKRHGLYVNTAGGFPITNVVFKNNGIGFCCNGTYGFTFKNCRFNRNYVDNFITTSTGSNTSITNIAEQTVSITDAFFPQHPGLQTWNNCSMSGNNNVYFEQPDNRYQNESDLRFEQVVFSPVNGCGFYANSGGLGTSITFDHCWFEGLLGASQIRGISIPARYIYNTVSDITIRGSAISNVEIANRVICKIEQCVIKGTFYKSDLAAYYGENLIGDDYSFDNYVLFGKNLRSDRDFNFITSPKTNLSGAFRDKLVASNACLATSTLPSGWTAITTDGVFSVKQCIEKTLAPTAFTSIETGLTTNINKVYVSTFAIKNTATASAYGYFYASGAASYITVTNKWKTIACVNTVSVASSSSTLSFYNPTEISQTLRVSGIQMLEFDNYDEAYSFLMSGDFVIA